MTALDDDLLPAVLNLLSELGKVLTYSLPAAGTYDPSNGDVTRAAPTTHSVKSLPPGDFTQYFGDDSLIKTADLQTGVAGQGLPFTPSLNMTVQVDGVAYTVLKVKPIYSGESVCLWLFALKRGV